MKAKEKYKNHCFPGFLLLNKTTNTFYSSRKNKQRKTIKRENAFKTLNLESSFSLTRINIYFNCSNNEVELFVSIECWRNFAFVNTIRTYFDLE